MKVTMLLFAVIGCWLLVSTEAQIASGSGGNATGTGTGGTGTGSGTGSSGTSTGGTGAVTGGSGTGTNGTGTGTGGTGTGTGTSGTGTGTGSGTPDNTTAPDNHNGACSYYHVGVPLIVAAFLSSLFGFL